MIRRHSKELSAEKPTESRFDLEIIDVVFSGTPEYSHDARWGHLDGSKAAIAMKALVKAEEIRQTDIDPGDAYLKGVSQVLEIVRLQDEQQIESIERFTKGTDAA